MKKIPLFFLTTAWVLVCACDANAQDSVRGAAKKLINNSSGQSDKLNGRRIQQQQLNTNRFEKLGTGIPANTVCRKKNDRSKKRNQP